MCWDALHGYILLAEKLLASDRAQFASSFNFGPDSEDSWPVERLATKIANAWGDGACRVHDTGPSIHEAGYLRLDASKARAALGWRPRLQIEAALDWTMDWFRSCELGEDMAQVTRAQIARFEHLDASTL